MSWVDHALTLPLGLSLALNIAFIAGLIASVIGPGALHGLPTRSVVAQSVLVGASAASAFLALWFAAVSAYR
ncbi:hypothetical protein ACFXJ5_13180 [Streptomyces sp. NPDC059373]